MNSGEGNLPAFFVDMDEIAKKFKGRKVLPSRTVPIYPKSAEREIQRLVGAYFIELSKVVRDGGSYKHIERMATGKAVSGRIDKISRQVQYHAIREWKRCLQDTLGADVPADYYTNLFKDTAEEWKKSVAEQLSGFPEAAKQYKKEILRECRKKGMTKQETRRELSMKLASQKRQAKARAVASVANLFGDLSRLQQKDAGCKRYKWRTQRDSRVRSCHRALEGKIFSWDNPPMMWRETAHGIVYTGERCNPGEDWGCRCIAIPVFDISSLTLPDMGE